MILSTHIIIAAAASKPFWGRPIAVFLIALASHYVMDMIPHWEYGLSSVDERRDAPLESRLRFDISAIIFDLFKLFVDIFIGAAVIFYLIQPALNFSSLFLFFLLVAGAILPDSLWVLYWLFPQSFLLYLSKFHLFVHPKLSLREKPFLGISSQIVINLIAVAIIVLV